MESKKPYYSIGQVAEYLELPQSVLRYWETVFDALQPAKSPGGSRRYSDQDLKILNDIKHLLYDRGFTIRGANKILNQKYHIKAQKGKADSTDKLKQEGVGSGSSVKKEESSAALNSVNQQVIKKIISELKEIVKDLER